MAWEHREGQFSLFPNKYKEAGDNKPALRGDGMFNGQMVEVALWKKQSQDGNTFYSGQIKPKEMQQQSPSAAPLEEAIDDEIPF